MFIDSRQAAYDRAVQHHHMAVGALRAAERRYRWETGQEPDGALDTTRNAGEQLKRAIRREQMTKREVRSTARALA